MSVDRLCDDCGDPISWQSESGLCRTCSQQPERRNPPAWPGEWRQRGACRKGMWNVEMWFESVGRSVPYHCGREWCRHCYCAAKLVCGGCPVRDDCLEHALRNGETAGVWGGLTVEDRKQLRRRQRAARKAS